MKKQNTITIILFIFLLIAAVADIVWMNKISKQINKLDERQVTMENNLKAYFQTME